MKSHLDKTEVNKKKIEDQQKELKKIIAHATSTEEGVILARWVMNQCGFLKQSVVVNPTTSEININSTIYMEARRNLWLSLRSLIPEKALKCIEYEKTILKGDYDG